MGVNTKFTFKQVGNPYVESCIVEMVRLYRGHITNNVVFLFHCLILLGFFSYYPLRVSSTMF